MAVTIGYHQQPLEADGVLIFLPILNWDDDPK